ncbi:4350_t:CDS:2, partial [Funneliformis caledonium]
EQEYIDAVLEAITNIYNKNYKYNLPIIINNEVDDPNDFLVNIFGKSNKINKDKLEDYFQKPDFLSISGISIPIKRIFSGGIDLITKKRSSLNQESIRAYMCLKNF